MPLKCSYIREMHVKVQILAFVVEISCDFIDRHDLGRIGIGFFLHQWILNFLMLLFSPRRQSVYLAPPSSNPSWIKEALPPEHPSHIPPYGGCTREQAFEQCFNYHCERSTLFLPSPPLGGWPPRRWLQGGGGGRLTLEPAS